ncbi:hypothetical protein BC826DRAFT_317749 [Russula brevipes]|nr:hypothetical protein BC826DRAFT_317749 [Russula brevipes]
MISVITTHWIALIPCKPFNTLIFVYQSRYFATVSLNFDVGFRLKFLGFQLEICENRSKPRNYFKIGWSADANPRARRRGACQPITAITRTVVLDKCSSTLALSGLMYYRVTYLGLRAMSAMSGELPQRKDRDGPPPPCTNCT